MSSNVVPINQFQPPAEPKEPPITIQDAEDAAKAAGLAVIRVKKLEASAKIGKFLDQLGVKRIGKTGLVMAHEAVEEGIKQCDEAIRTLDGSEDPGPIIEIMKLRTALIGQMITTNTNLIKSEDLPEAAPTQSLRLAFPAHSGNVNVAVVSNPPKPES